MKQDNSKELQLLNAEQIKARRVPLEDAEITPSKTNKWHCGYCNKKFSGETYFLRHHCEPRRRIDELKSPLGQAAYGYYKDWMRLKKFSAPGPEAFMESKYYRTFINFAQMVIDSNLSRPDRYIELMLEGGVQPMLWCREQCYAVYLEWMDKLTDPIEQVSESINYLMDICEKEEVELPEIFNHLGAQRLLSLIRQRRLTPWFLFCSPAFGKILKTLDKSQLTVFNNVVNSSYWGDRFQKEKATLETIKNIVKEMGL